MGTELLHVLNPLGTLEKRIGDALNIAADAADSLAYCRRIFLQNTSAGFGQLRKSMDQLLEQCNRETVRKAMLKQEETFKEQVRELHRLYRVQKTLMAELRGGSELKHSLLTNSAPGMIHINSDYRQRDTRTGYWTNAESSQTIHSPYSSNIQHPATGTKFYNFHQNFDVRSGPSSHEGSSCSGHALSMHRGFDLEQPAEKENFTEFSVMGTTKGKVAIESSRDADGENDIELTLSIGHPTDTKKKHKYHPSSCHELGCSESTPNETRQPLIQATNSDREEECSDAAGANFDQEGLQRPHWPSQNLRLNRT